MALATRYFAWQARLVAPELGRRILEVGCGLGNFTGMLLGREAVIAVDAEPRCIARLRLRYPNRPKLHAFVCDAQDPAFRDLASYRPDTCVCLNVLEHIADDRAALEAMASVVVTGGAIVLLAPAFQSLYGPIDRNLGHFRRYNRDSLTRLVRMAGLYVEKVHYVNSIGLLGWWLNSRVFKRQAQSEWQIRIFDRALVPVLSRVERWAQPPFGQSLFAVLRKP
jgi:SAM-dependent methyltransferase